MLIIRQSKYKIILLKRFRCEITFFQKFEIDFSILQEIFQAYHEVVHHIAATDKVNFENLVLHKWILDHLQKST